MSLKRIAITGHRGVIARSIAKHCPQFELLAFPGDLTRPQDVQAWIQSLEAIDGFIHFGSVTQIDQVNSDPYRAFQVNVGGTLSVLQAWSEVPESKRPWILVGSSSHVYSPLSEPQRLSEQAELNPMNLYGLTKIQSEEWAGWFTRHKAMKICITRIFSCNSEFHPSTYAIPAIARRIAQAKPGEKLPVRGFHSIRDFVTGEQVARTLSFLQEHAAMGTYNIGTGHGTSIGEIARVLKMKLGREDVELVPADEERSSLVADPGRLRSLGIALELDLDKLLAPALASASPSMAS